MGSIRKWWDDIQTCGPKYGYFPNPTKIRLIVKEHLLSEATNLFADTGISVTVSGTRYHGVAIGTPTFVKTFVDEKVKSWVDEIPQSILQTQSIEKFSFAEIEVLVLKWESSQPY